jgi:hypothetical protein
MKKLLILSLLLMPVISQGGILYNNNFGGVEPPDNWTLIETNPSGITSCTFTAQSNYGYMDVSKTVYSNRAATWRYNNGYSWSNYTESFNIYDWCSNTNTAFLVGLFSQTPASDGFSYGFNFTYNVAAGSWKVASANMTPSLNAAITTPVRGDIFSFSIAGGISPIIDFYINTANVYHGVGTSSSVYNGTIKFSTTTGNNTYSHVAISNLVVFGTNDTPTITPTSSPTNTASPTPTDIQSATNTPSPTITFSPTDTASPSPSPTNTASPTNTSSPSPSPTNTSSPTVTPTYTVYQARFYSKKNKNWWYFLK